MKVAQISQQILPSATKEVQANQAEAKDLKLEKSAKDLEGLFLTFVLKAMDKTIPRESESSNSMANMMFSTVMGKGLADQGGMGLAQFFYNSLAQNSPDELAALKEQINEPTNTNINPLRTLK